MLFTHVTLLASTLLAVGLPTDVWLVALGEAARGDRQDGWPHLLLGALEADGPELLDCAVTSGGGGRHRECIKAAGFTNCGGTDTNTSVLLLSHLSFHRPRYMVSEVRRLAAGAGWVELLVVAGRAAHVYRIGQRGSGVKGALTDWLIHGFFGRCATTCCRAC